MGDDPPYLTVGTEVSAKYKGAFCEAKIRKVVRIVKCKVTFKSGLGSTLVSEDQIKGTLRVGASVEAKHPEKNQFIDAVVNKIQDCSQYTVVFDDGDITTLRRSALCLKSGRHFNESETLDQLPLTHPEHFSNPVVGGRRGVRRRNLNAENDKEDSSDDEDVPTKKGRKKNDREVDMGKVVCVELTDKKKGKDSWFPALVVSPSAQETVKIRTKDEYLVRSFRDGRYYTVPKKETKDFKDNGDKYESNSNLLRAAVEKATNYIEKNELPPHWDREILFGHGNTVNEESNNSDDQQTESDSSEDDPTEDKDRFVAQLYKFMDDRGTPINKVPLVCNKDLDLYKLYKIVKTAGGYNKVTNGSQWKSVTIKMGYGAMPSTSTINLVKQSYKKCVHHFEEFNRKLGCTMNSRAAPTTKSRSSRQFFREKHASGSTKDLKKEEPEDSSKKEEEKDKQNVKSSEAEAEPIVSDVDSKKPEQLEDSRRSRSRQESRSRTKEPEETPEKPPKAHIKNKRISIKEKEKEKEPTKDEPSSPAIPPKKGGRGKKKETEEETEKSEPEEVLDHIPNHVFVDVAHKLLVYYGPQSEKKVVYEAKVLKTNMKTKSFLVHYTGWNTRYDEWIKRGRISENLTFKPDQGKPAQGRGPAGYAETTESESSSSTKVSTKSPKRKPRIIPSTPTAASGTRSKSGITRRKRFSGESEIIKRRKTRQKSDQGVAVPIPSVSGSDGESSDSEDKAVPIVSTPPSSVSSASSAKTGNNEKRNDDDDASSSSTSSSISKLTKDNDGEKDKQNQVIDLNQIRSEMKGLDKMVKLTSTPTPPAAPTPPPTELKLDIYDFQEDDAPKLKMFAPRSPDKKDEKTESIAPVAKVVSPDIVAKCKVEKEPLQGESVPSFNVTPVADNKDTKAEPSTEAAIDKDGSGVQLDGHQSIEKDAPTKTTDSNIVEIKPIVHPVSSQTSKVAPLSVQVRPPMLIQRPSAPLATGSLIRLAVAGPQEIVVRPSPKAEVAITSSQLSAKQDAKLSPVVSKQQELPPHFPHKTNILLQNPSQPAINPSTEVKEAAPAKASVTSISVATVSDGTAKSSVTPKVGTAGKDKKHVVVTQLIDSTMAVTSAVPATQVSSPSQPLTPAKKKTKKIISKRFVESESDSSTEAESPKKNAKKRQRSETPKKSPPTKKKKLEATSKSIVSPKRHIKGRPPNKKSPINIGSSSKTDKTCALTMSIQDEPSSGERLVAEKLDERKNVQLSPDIIERIDKTQMKQEKYFVMESVTKTEKQSDKTECLEKDVVPKSKLVEKKEKTNESCGKDTSKQSKHLDRKDPITENIEKQVFLKLSKQSVQNLDEGTLSRQAEKQESEAEKPKIPERKEISSEKGAEKKDKSIEKIVEKKEKNTEKKAKNVERSIEKKDKNDDKHVERKERNIEKTLEKKIKNVEKTLERKEKAGEKPLEKKSKQVQKLEKSLDKKDKNAEKRPIEKKDKKIEKHSDKKEIIAEVDKKREKTVDKEKNCETNEKQIEKDTKIDKSEKIADHVDKPKSVENLGKSFDKPKETVSKPDKPFEKPAKHIEKQGKNVDKGNKSVVDKVGKTEKTKSVEKQVKHSDKFGKGLDSLIEKVAKLSEKQIKDTDKPVKPTEKREKLLEKQHTSVTKKEIKYERDSLPGDKDISGQISNVSLIESEVISKQPKTEELPRKEEIQKVDIVSKEEGKKPELPLTNPCSVDLSGCAKALEKNTILPTISVTIPSKVMSLNLVELSEKKQESPAMFFVSKALEMNIAKNEESENPVSPPNSFPTTAEKEVPISLVSDEVIAKSPEPGIEDEIVISRVKSLEKQDIPVQDDISGLLFCEEIIPGSPTAEDSSRFNFDDEEEKSAKGCSNINTASLTKPSGSTSEDQANLELIDTTCEDTDKMGDKLSRPLILEKDDLNKTTEEQKTNFNVQQDTPQSMETTPPLTPEISSGSSISSGSPRNEPDGRSPLAVRGSSKSKESSDGEEDLSEFPKSIDNGEENYLSNEIGGKTLKVSLPSMSASGPSRKTRPSETRSSRNISPPAKRRRMIRRKSPEEVVRSYPYRGRSSTGRKSQTGMSSDSQDQHKTMPPPPPINLGRPPRSSRFNFIPELDDTMDSEQRIALITQAIQDLREKYMSVKSEMVSFERRRKRWKKREKEKALAERVARQEANRLTS